MGFGPGAGDVGFVLEVLAFRVISVTADGMFFCGIGLSFYTDCILSVRAEPTRFAAKEVAAGRHR